MGGKALPASLSSVSLVKFFPRSKISVDFLGFKDEINLASNGSVIPSRWITSTNNPPSDQ
jgi:hypothetical protein